jgi:hypothetical protein
VTCIGCKYHVQDWRLCLHPLSQSADFWKNPTDYWCRVETDVPETDFGKIEEEPKP